MSRETDDILEIVDDILRADEVLKEHLSSETDGFKSKFFKYPETADMEGSWVVLEPIINGLPSNMADETWVTYDYLIHIEVWSRKREDNLIIANRIRDLLWEKLKFKQNDDTDEYDLGIYRDARRYKGTLHRSDLDTL